MGHLKKEDYFVLKQPKLTPEVKAIVSLQHYSKGGSRTATDVHTLHHRQDPFQILGVAWWLPTTKNAAISVAGDNWRRCVSLSRFTIDPSIPTNGASFLLGQSIRILKTEGRWDVLVTWADQGQGHTGAIYKATNWELMGETEPAYRYVDSEGRMVSRKSSGYTRSHASMLRAGYTAEGPFRKWKFRYVVRKAGVIPTPQKVIILPTPRWTPPWQS